MPSVATCIQKPGGVGSPGFTPAAFIAQKVAICICSAVRVSEMWRISASAARKAAEPKAGGGPGRNWLAEVRNQGRIPGTCPPPTVGGVVLLVHKPGPTGMVPVKELPK